jgi:glutamate-1-semialdehyde 2,1-aminomutase
MPRSTKLDADLRERASRVIPGGMYGHESVALLPPGFPQFFARAEGARLWDADGNEYLDYLCAYGPNLFGYADLEIDDAAAAQLVRGDTMTGPSPIMVDLAEALVAMVAHASWAMFCKNGTDATSLALAAARAHTGRRKILLAAGAYHGAAAWCTPNPTGTLPEERAHLIAFAYNDVESLERAAREAGDDLAGVLVSPHKHDAFVDQELPTREFAHAARALCDHRGALLILDEVRGGFRLARDGSWTHLGVQPDLSAWGKCLANGHALAALLGSEPVRAAAARLYATGSFWFQAAPMAAALVTLRRIRETDYLERTQRLGERLRDGLAAQAAAHGYALRQTGPPQMPQILFERDPDLRLGCAWTAEALERGIYLHPWHNMFLCAALTQADVEHTLAMTDEAFAALRRRHATLKPHPQLAALLGATRRARGERKPE